MEIKLQWLNIKQKHTSVFHDLLSSWTPLVTRAFYLYISLRSAVVTNRKGILVSPPFFFPLPQYPEFVNVLWLLVVLTQHKYCKIREKHNSIPLKLELVPMAAVQRFSLQIQGKIQYRSFSYASWKHKQSYVHIFSECLGDTSRIITRYCDWGGWCH